MGVFSQYLIAVVFVVFIITIVYQSAVSITPSANNTFQMNTSFQEKIINTTSDIEQTMKIDTQTDPNNPADLAVYFSKTLAIAGKVVGLLIDAVLSSVDFVKSILTNIASLPAPWNIVGVVVSFGLTIFTIYIVMTAAKVFTGKEW